jgi:hypothetical protein
MTSAVTTAWDSVPLANQVEDSDVVLLVKSDGRTLRVKPSLLAAGVAQQVQQQAAQDTSAALAQVQATLGQVSKKVDDSAAELSITLVDAQTKIGDNAAAITDEVTLRVSGDEALASEITTLSATVAGNTAAITTEQTARATQDTALASSIATLSAALGSTVHTYLQSATPSSPHSGDLWIDTGNNYSLKRYNGTGWDAVDNTQIAANTAAISTEATTRAANDATIASSVTSVAAIANGASANGSMKLTAAVSPTDGATAQFDVQIATSSTGTFSNAGMTIQIFSDGTRRVKFNANQFFVTDGSTNQVPFAIVSGQLLASALKVPNANVNGLGALALKSAVTYGTSDTSGFGSLAGQSSVNANTQVTGLGLMAFISKLTASNLATYMDTAIIGSAYISDLSADKITAGTLNTGTIMTGSLRVNDGSGNWIIRADYGATYASLWKPFSTGGAQFSAYGTNAVYSSCGGSEAIYGYGFGGGSGHGVRGYSSSGCTGIVGTAYGYDFYADGSGTNYGPFTGAHDALLDPAEDFQLGDIVVDQTLVYRGGISNTLFKVTRSTSPNQKGAVGVIAVINGPLSNHEPLAVFGRYVEAAPTTTPGQGDPPPQRLDLVWPDGAEDAWNAAKGSYNYALMNALGEGQINVCGEGGDLEVGDLIVTSSTPGKGMRQADDIVRGCTVARAREAVTFSGPTDVKLVACIYLCG